MSEGKGEEEITDLHRTRRPRGKETIGKWRNDGDDMYICTQIRER